MKRNIPGIVSIEYTCTPINILNVGGIFVTGDFRTIPDIINPILSYQRDNTLTTTGRKVTVSLTAEMPTLPHDIEKAIAFKIKDASGEYYLIGNGEIPFPTLNCSTENNTKEKDNRASIEVLLTSKNAITKITA